MLALIPAVTWATSISPPPSLEARIIAADHIFVGTVKSISVIGADGNHTEKPPSPLPQETRIQLIIKPETPWIATPLRKLPDFVAVTYDVGKMILSYDSEKEHYLNKKWVFLLSGEDFHPAAFLAFAEPESQLEEIKAIITQAKKPIE